MAGRRARRNQRLEQARKQEAIEQAGKREGTTAATLLDDEGTLTLMISLGSGGVPPSGPSSDPPSGPPTPSEQEAVQRKLWVLKPSTGTPIDLTDIVVLEEGLTTVE